MSTNGGKSRQVTEKNGGASRARTDDLIVANDALSQLSYSPEADSFSLSRIILPVFSAYHYEPRAKYPPPKKTLTNSLVARLTYR